MLKTDEEIEQARNLLASALCHEAMGKQPEVFNTSEEFESAVHQMSCFNWLFGDEDSQAFCDRHQTCNTSQDLALLYKRLKAAGYTNPQNEEAYSYLKDRMGQGLSMWDALRELRPKRRNEARSEASRQTH